MRIGCLSLPPHPPTHPLLPLAALGVRPSLCYKPRPLTNHHASGDSNLAAHLAMRNFSRALKLALSHRVKIAACVFTSIVIAVLWGGNLTAVFPVVEVIMNDHSLPDWIDQKIAESQVEIDDSTRWLTQLQKLDSSTPDKNPERIQTEIERPN